MKNLAFGMILALLVGCGGPKIVPVSGKVTVDNKPIANLLVCFEPVGTKEKPYVGHGSTGITDAEGRFVLKTVGEQKNGALVGKHRVRILLSNQIDETDIKNLPKTANDMSKQLPAEFNDESTLTFEVPNEGSSEANFNLEVTRKK